MKQYTVTQLSGEFRLETGMNNEQMEKFVRDNWNYGVDYSDEFQTFESKQYALDFFEFLKKKCIVKEFPSNKLMMVYWIRIDEAEVDEDGDEDFMETLDEYFPSNEEPGDSTPRIGARIAEERIKKNLSQTELAERIGTTRQQIGKYETDTQDMTVARLFQIAAALGITPDTLVKKS